jgi:hypothetical protein
LLARSEVLLKLQNAIHSSFDATLLHFLTIYSIYA